MINQSPVEKKFVQNPYVFYRQILKKGGVCFWENYNQKAFFNFETINKIFKDNGTISHGWINFTKKIKKELIIVFQVLSFPSLALLES